MFKCNKVVAWRSWDEWKETYHLLYSNNVKEIKCGCNRVSSWQIKQILPIAVEVTASLLRELYSDEKNTSALSLAIIRFINGVVEPFKNANLSVPISTIGASYGVPEFVVTLRHAATHGRMPSFEFAAIGAKSALEWLKTNYWEAQLNEINSIEQEVHDQIMSFIFNSSTGFEENSPNVIQSFGIEELVKLVLNKNQKRNKVSDTFKNKIAELLERVTKRYKYFYSAFSYRIAEETSKGNEVAGAWLEFLYEKKILPYKNVSLILRWANPTLLGGAVPIALISDILESAINENENNENVNNLTVESEMNRSFDFSSINVQQEQPAWPPTSIGFMPIGNGSLTLADDEFAFVEPGEDAQIVEEDPNIVNAERESELSQKIQPKKHDHENTLEIW
ncbi:Las1-like family protein [Tritrichomonas foetus]|uniref:Las1-like family protein n=1 Tax=Tritrichomonas foetus TaxID=1144522 RepID=A0A1J4KNZ2_9EUKA|nr:Las1-like family protein [Tritrichomonas foetus]|eukprot:OHT13007.1 Las1-like family protein [Tritrichomonas foetus]